MKYTLYEGFRDSDFTMTFPNQKLCFQVNHYRFSILNEYRWSERDFDLIQFSKRMLFQKVARSEFVHEFWNLFFVRTIFELTRSGSELVWDFEIFLAPGPSRC